MKQSLLFQAGLICLSLIVLCMLASLNSVPSTYILNLNSGNSELNYIHKIFNFSLLWPNYWIELLNSHPLFSIPSTLSIAGLALMLVSMFWLTKLIVPNKIASSLSVALGVCVLAITLWGHDFLVFSLFGFFVLLGFLAFHTITSLNHAKRWLLILILATIACCYWVQILCLIPISLGLALAVLLKKELYPHYPVFRNNPDRIAFLIPILIAVIFLGLSSWPSIPNYSPLGHVVQDDGLPGNILPLFTPSASIPIIDRHILKQLLFSLAFIHLAFAVFLWLVTNRSMLLKTVLISSLIVWLDVVPSEAVSQISPLACLERLIPGFAFFPLSFLFSLINSFLLVLILVRLSNLLVTPLAAITLFIVIPFIQLKFDESLIPGIFVPNSIHNAEKQFISLRQQDINWDNNQKYLLSPSYAVLNKTGLWPLTIPEIIKHWSFTSLFKEKPEIIASADNLSVANLIDRNINTRWSPGGGQQLGNEWIFIKLKDPIALHGIELATGPYHTDFPRGLEIWFKEDCELNNQLASQPLHAGFELVASHPIWEGPLVMTESGFPYFGGQGLGKIYFTKPLTGSCYIIKQVGNTKKFDWSVSQIRVLRYPQ